MAGRRYCRNRSDEMNAIRHMPKLSVLGAALLLGACTVIPTGPVTVVVTSSMGTCQPVPMTFQPFLAKRRALAAPKPAVAPVMRAVRGVCASMPPF